MSIERSEQALIRRAIEVVREAVILVLFLQTRVLPGPRDANHLHIHWAALWGDKDMLDAESMWQDGLQNVLLIYLACEKTVTENGMKSTIETVGALPQHLEACQGYTAAPAAPLGCCHPLRPSFEEWAAAHKE